MNLWPQRVISLPHSSMVPSSDLSSGYHHLQIFFSKFFLLPCGFNFASLKHAFRWWVSMWMCVRMMPCDRLCFLFRSMTSPSWNTCRTSQWNSLHQESQWSVLKAPLMLFFFFFPIAFCIVKVWRSFCVTAVCSVSNQSFTLEFHFEPNSYFSNTILTKTYKMKSEPDSADPFSFEGPEIVDCEGWVTVTLYTRTEICREESMTCCFSRSPL